ncbi:NmrA family NAD(P)-binding protein [[Mycobacterium] wendilense]|uniref:NmrA family NAD(P)-binding protein n=1 Tax=[Mycobacterium] wendilense TaxID=3064284 RepID=A0ABM9ME11_9MYCO|nr:NmrA family NAD(P)-binding protein [Mycolicibacterium sp. MU0050]CAJ1582867.1 NmrA family NAD(P)-binding protein [Mycolicibacterium sp. MU0050]
MSNPQFSQTHAILVVGAGELGGSVLAALSRRSEAGPVTVLLRPSSTPQGALLRADLTAQGIAVVEADVATASVTELSTVMRPFNTVVSCLGFAAGPGTQRKITEAALKAGVGRYLPWQFGVDYDAIGDSAPWGGGLRIGVGSRVVINESW